VAEHPITPPPELVASLRNSAPHGIGGAGVTRELWLINHAYALGADQELEACVELWANNSIKWTSSELHEARRPKPPSLKEQALTALTRYTTGETILTNDSVETIRRALEAHALPLPTPEATND
jgi:hypothetical protein